MNLWQSFLARFRRKPKRTAYGVIDKAIDHELAAEGIVYLDIIEDRHPTLNRCSVAAALRRRVKAGTLVRDGKWYRPAPEIKAVELRAVES